MPLGSFTVSCPRCGRATPFAHTLPWLGTAAVGIVILLGFGAVAWIRIASRHAPDPSRPVPDSVITLAPAPPRGMAAALDSAEAASGSRSRVRVDTARSPGTRPSNLPDRRGVEINAHPPDANALDGLGPGQKRRSALDALLRRGLADSLRERPPGTVQVFVGRAFFRQPRQFRDPLMKALDLAWADELGNRRTFELWWDTFPLGEYARDTFKFGKWYYELR
jgi:hypothetical protein